MHRLIHALSRRRRGRPAPIWRARPYRPAIDIRLPDMNEGMSEDRLGPADEGSPGLRRRRREIWEL